MSKDRKGPSEEFRAVRARQRAIGRELRRLFEGVVREPLPDEFVELLAKIDQADQKKTTH